MSRRRNRSINPGADIQVRTSSCIEVLVAWAFVIALMSVAATAIVIVLSMILGG